MYVPPSPMADMLPEDRALGEILSELLREHRGNVGAVGRAMGKAPIQIRRWCDRLQIELSDDGAGVKLVAVRSQPAARSKLIARRDSWVLSISHVVSSGFAANRIRSFKAGYTYY